VPFRARSWPGGGLALGALHEVAGGGNAAILRIGHPGQRRPDIAIIAKTATASVIGSNDTLTRD
jgi:hypothetical protein